ncbi:MAG: secretin and TonB N-terminal domain-containing protein [Oligoflexia bacterium]|nr:secretin and TonB N-terminal domain-containing protein [Oligoflexia bacterium]
MKKIWILVLLAILGSCSTNRTLSDNDNDPFAIFKTPAEKARMHYLKKGQREYVYVEGDKLKDYTVVTSDNGMALNVKGYRIIGSSDTLSSSDVINDIRTLPTVDGSTLDISTKGRQGFRIYKRKSGLVLAMGNGYKEIADDELDELESEVVGNTSANDQLDDLLEASKDRDLKIMESEQGMKGAESDAALSDLEDEFKNAKPSAPVKSDLDRELDELAEEAPKPKFEEDILDLEPEPKTGDADLAFDEVEEVDTELNSSSRIRNIEFLRLTDSTRLVVSSNKTVEYEKSEAPDHNQVIIDIRNTYLPKRFARPLDTSEFQGPVTMISPYQLKGPYRTVRLVIQLRSKVVPQISQEDTNLYVDFPIGDEGILQAEEEDLAMAGMVNVDEFAPTEVNDVEAARKMSRMNFQDYLAKPMQFYGTRMSIEVAQADVMDVLRLIQEVSGMNIVVSGNVKGNINLSLKNVPWDQALSVVLQNAQLGYVRQGSVIRVAPLTDLRDERQLAAQAVEANNSLEPIRLLVLKLDYIEAERIKDKISVILSSRGKVSVDTETNSLIITDIEENVLKASRLLKAIDKKPAQIVIESNIIEASEAWIRGMGFNWATDGGDIGFRNVSGYGNISTVIGAASVKGDVRIISAPRISTLDRKKASIIQGTQVAYKTSTPLEGGGVTDKIEFENISVELNVVPKVTSKNEIILDIDVKREFPDYMLRSSRKLPPGVGVRKAVSQVLLSNGGTAVIGGLYSVDNGDADAGVPLLKKIPIIGWFFGKSETREMKTELLIFLKATIVEESSMTAMK